jgi:hypothetical protein
MKSDVVLGIIALESRETGFAHLQTVEWRYGRRCSALLTDLNRRGLLAWGASRAPWRCPAWAPTGPRNWRSSFSGGPANFLCLRRVSV